ncbi:hypothetical protein ACS8E2_05650 [Psychrobacter glaciei]|uniref:hypothetical protein n=1 Tax=Psychrobacter glaciei TaxID=619771 RepID=UPI003F474007
MENFRLFLIRFLQAAWVVVALFAVLAFFIEGQFRVVFDTVLVAGIPLVIIQFLIFSRLNPYELFDGRIKENLRPKVNN